MLCLIDNHSEMVCVLTTEPASSNLADLFYTFFPTFETIVSQPIHLFRSYLFVIIIKCHRERSNIEEMILIKEHVLSWQLETIRCDRLTLYELSIDSESESFTEISTDSESES